MSDKELKLEPSWKARVGDYLARPEMQKLSAFLRDELRAGKTIYPAPKNIFAALNTTPFDDVKVVIIGQDPYHGPRQAHGLCFSVMPGVAIPPSLDNILKETQADVGTTRPDHGCLITWARQGVLLLNSVLTVESGRPESHKGKGWEGFTDAVVDHLNRERENLVFLLWGSHAQAKGKLVDIRRHTILKAPHPSPLSAHRGFFGSKHFSRTNNWLADHGLTPIDWQLPPAATLVFP